jgi:hypothetical protein
MFAFLNNRGVHTVSHGITNLARESVLPVLSLQGVNNPD